MLPVLETWKKRGSDDRTFVTGPAPRIAILSNDPQLQAKIFSALETAKVPGVLLGRGVQEGAEAFPESCELLILDMDGLNRSAADTMSLIRSKSKAAIIALSIRTDEESKVRALNAGADDYVTLPFGSREFLARIRAALRSSTRPGHSPNESPASIASDSDRRVLHFNGREIRFTSTEWRLFSILAEEAGRIVPHERLLRTVWGPAAERRVHYLRIYMNKLRSKLEADPLRPVHLLTVPKLGYLFLPFPVSSNTESPPTTDSDA